MHIDSNSLIRKFVVSPNLICFRNRQNRIQRKLSVVSSKLIFQLADKSIITSKQKIMLLSKSVLSKYFYIKPLKIGIAKLVTDYKTLTQVFHDIRQALFATHKENLRLHLLFDFYFNQLITFSLHVKSTFRFTRKLNKNIQFHLGFLFKDVLHEMVRFSSVMRMHMIRIEYVNV